MNVANLLRRARDLDAGLKRDSEHSRIGTLRGGSSGTLSKQTGDVTGTCHRRSHLRSLGIIVEPQADDAKSIIFARGKDQEFSVLEDIESSLEFPYKMLREEEIPTQWETTNGTKVTGRPDGVICEMQNNGLNTVPRIGLEVKSIGSVWVTKSILLELQPKLPHLQQAGHYMWQLGVPYKLIYRQNSQLILPNYPFMLKLLPTDESDFRYKLIKFDKAGRPLEILPYTIVYDLALDKNQRVMYKLEHEPESAYRATIVTIPELQAYYEYVSKLGPGADLGPRPKAVTAFGEKLNYTDCDYCMLKPTCTAFEKSGYETWLAEVKRATQVLNK